MRGACCAWGVLVVVVLSLAFYQVGGLCCLSGTPLMPQRAAGRLVVGRGFCLGRPGGHCGSGGYPLFSVVLSGAVSPHLDVIRWLVWLGVGLFFGGAGCFLGGSRVLMSPLRCAIYARSWLVVAVPYNGHRKGSAPFTYWIRSNRDV